jgi:ornithine cyclodeaminase/alanine dehydrogenase-like protein (mu-crystallin family)
LDVVLSCVTVANEIIGKDEWYEQGVLVVPVHTKGFQNCDLFFDRIFVDDIGHVNSFKYFNQFNYCKEFSLVLKGEDPGRQDESERLLAYNIGIALQDIFFASKIFNILGNSIIDIDLQKAVNKFWV